MCKVCIVVNESHGSGRQPTSLDIDLENCLVGLEDHAGVHLEVLVEVQPRAVRACLVV